MRSALVVAMVCAVASAHAAPWSIELPRGYTEEPVPAGQLETLRTPPALAVDAQQYVSPARDVTLKRISVIYRLAGPPTRAKLDDFDRQYARTLGEVARVVSSTRRFAGNQLVSEHAYDLPTGVRVVERRLYSIAANRTVHALVVECAGGADRLAECTMSQQRMQLTLPATDQADVMIDASELPLPLALVALVFVTAPIASWFMRRREWRRPTRERR